jgi:hypothetical protein
MALMCSHAKAMTRLFCSKTWQNIPRLNDDLKPVQGMHMATKGVWYGLAFSTAALALLFGFWHVDFYHRGFYNPGTGVIGYNLARILITCLISWVIYVSGRATLALVVRPFRIAALPALERWVASFATGLGVWHVLLLLLGLANLYYRDLFLAICLTILLLSSPHLKAILGQTSAAASQLRKAGRGDIARWSIVVIPALLLLLMRGLFPGGGGDYYDHYFPYYQEVIKNHGLTPNDVWYHFYYSKGAGLYFLAISLSDPMAPSLVTLACVLTAALGIFALIDRLAPKTFWPSLAAGIYLVANLVPLRHGGEFQKLHEEMSALVVLVAVALCMRAIQPRTLRGAWLAVGAFASVGAAILTQAIGVFLSIYFLLGVAKSLFKRAKDDFVAWSILCGATGFTTVAVLLINYSFTGLLTDQALDITWKLADFRRLEQWGVIPNLILVAWIRDNYKQVYEFSISATLQNLIEFLRADALWILIATSLFLILLRIKLPKENKLSPTSLRAYRSSSAVCWILFSFIGVFGLLSIPAGNSQPVSYFRFSTFFLPLVALACIACWTSFGSTRPRLSSSQHWRTVAPCLLLVATMASWGDWYARAYSAGADAVRFAIGRYSLADAYGKVAGPYEFGAIHPATSTAVKSLPAGARVWSTNVDLYCMAPDCIIESVISFKLSPRLNEVLNGPPEQARDILREEGLNFFLFSARFPLLDILPYSHLFDPSVIERFLGVKWTDGETYLLTWAGPDTQPLGPDFMRQYEAKLAEPEHPWFRFNKVLPYLDEMTASLAIPPRFQHSNFPWPRERPKVQIATPDRESTGVQIATAAYGANCQGWSLTSLFGQSSSQGNVTAKVRQICYDKAVCDFAVNAVDFGDPATGCAKDFSVSYHCPDHQEDFKVGVSGEALGKKVELNCSPQPATEIRVLSASYGANCRRVSPGNATMAVQEACRGKLECKYAVDVAKMGDPAGGCKKEFSVDYQCPSGKRFSTRIAAEANGATASLLCGSDP